MMYTFECKSCKTVTDYYMGVKDRNVVKLCEKCGSELKRLYKAPDTSKLIGIQESAKRDGVGALVDENNNICYPINRGSKKEREEDRKKMK